MTTTWTSPVLGATLAELLDAADDRLIINRLVDLIPVYGDNAKGGIELREGSTRELDVDRITGNVFENNLKTWTNEQQAG